MAAEQGLESGGIVVGAGPLQREDDVIAMAAAEGGDAEVDENERDADSADNGDAKTLIADGHAFDDGPEDEGGVAGVLKHVAEADHGEDGENAQGDENVAGHEKHH